MQQKTLDFLEAHENVSPSDWREDIQWRRDNRSWLEHSQKMAVKVLLCMKRKGMTQDDLAQKMGCSRQCISKILKGKENLSLAMIAKLESALDIKLILCRI